MSALEGYIARRQAQDDFLARGLHSAHEARQANDYISAAKVVLKLERKLADAKKKAKPLAVR